MGYQTTYSLSIHPAEAREPFLEAVRRVAGYDPFAESCKWYEHEKHCLEASLQAAAYVVLDGEGEDAGDIWRKAYVCGRNVWGWKLDPKRPDVPADVQRQAIGAADAAWVERRDAALKAREDALKAELAEVRRQRSGGKTP